MYRHGSWLKTIDQNLRILEIGPLHNPLVPKVSNQKNIYYADIRSTEEIKALYKSWGFEHIDAIVSIDYVIKNSYSRDLKDVEPFDYVILSHVLEHMPQLIEFFNDIANILTPDGKLYIVVPDKRYGFDHYRYPTSFAECYDIYKRGVSNNPMRALDYFSCTTINEPAFWWKNPADYMQNIGWGGEEHLSYYEEALNNTKYHDAHFNVFTPESFLFLVYNLLRYNLFCFEIIDFFEADENLYDVCVILKKNDAAVNDEKEKSRISSNVLKLLEVNSDINNSIKECLKERNALLNSKSWRITKPLRFLAKIARSLLHLSKH
jgi:SAM-dependent methyltransferase